MSDRQQIDAGPDHSTMESDDAAQAAVQVQLELLQEENRRLRQEAVRARQTSHRRTALGLAAVGVIGVGSAALFPSLQTVLLVLGSIGLFGAVLTYYLTPERFVAAEVGDRIAAAKDASLQDIAGQLALTDQRIIIPTNGSSVATLYVPIEDVKELRDSTLPAMEALDSPFVTDSEGAQGLAVVPSGSRLYRRFREQGTSTTAATTHECLEILGEAISEQFELVDAVEIDSTTDSEATVRLLDPRYGEGSWFEDPLASFLGVGLATHLETPVSMSVQSDGTNRIVQYRWES